MTRRPSRFDSVVWCLGSKSIRAQSQSPRLPCPTRSTHRKGQLMYARLHVHEKKEDHADDRAAAHRPPSRGCSHLKRPARPNPWRAAGWCGAHSGLREATRTGGEDGRSQRIDIGCGGGFSGVGWVGGVAGVRCLVVVARQYAGVPFAAVACLGAGRAKVGYSQPTLGRTHSVRSNPPSLRRYETQSLGAA